jgi:hypothetical protein
MAATGTPTRFRAMLTVFSVLEPIPGFFSPLLSAGFFLSTAKIPGVEQA